MTPADLRALAADHAHIRHHPHEVAAALLAAAELIEHGQRRVAELIGVANALSVELRDALQGGEPVAWILQRGPVRELSFLQPKGDWAKGWSGCTAEPLYAAPQPVERRQPLTDDQITGMWTFPSDLSWMESVIKLARAIESAHGINGAT